MISTISFVIDVLIKQQYFKYLQTLDQTERMIFKTLKELMQADLFPYNTKYNLVASS